MVACQVAKEDRRTPAPPVDLARSPIRYGRPEAPREAAPHGPCPPGCFERIPTGRPWFAHGTWHLLPWFRPSAEAPVRTAPTPGHPYRDLSWAPPEASPTPTDGRQGHPDAGPTAP